jgi:hypothetical protein
MKRWIPSLAVAALILAVVAGGYVVASAMSVPSGPPVEAGRVKIFPLSGWQSREGQAAGLPAARLTRGNANLDVLSTETNTGAELVLARYVRDVLEPAANRLSLSDSVDEVVLDSGLPGLRVSYVGSFGDRNLQVEGEVTAVVSSGGTAAIFDAWGPEGLFGYVRGDAREMVATAEVP